MQATGTDFELCLKYADSCLGDDLSQLLHLLLELRSLDGVVSTHNGLQQGVVDEHILGLGVVK